MHGIDCLPLDSNGFEDILSVKGKEDKAVQGRNRLLMKFYSGTFRRGTLQIVIVLGCRMSG